MIYPSCSFTGYALNAQRGDSQGMTKVLEAQTKINATPNI
jgi:hypothetical protein